MKAIRLAITALAGLLAAPWTGPASTVLPLQDPPTPPIVKLGDKPVQLWPPGSTIPVFIADPGIADKDLNAAYLQTVQAQFTSWQNYQSAQWGANGYKFQFVNDPGAAKIRVGWVDHIPPDPNGNVPLGVTNDFGTPDDTIKDPHGRSTGIRIYNDSQATITLARKQPGSNDFLPTGLLGYTVEHEIGHAEGITIHDRSKPPGLMGEHAPAGNVQPVDLGTDKFVLAAKSAFQGARLPAAGNTPENNILVPSVGTFLGPQGTTSQFLIQSNPAGTDIFYEFAASVFAVPTSVSAPTGWDYEFLGHEPAFDSLLDGSPYTDPSGIGYLLFSTADLSFAILPGMELPFSFTTPGAVDLGSVQLYAVTTDGNAEFLLVPVPEPISLCLALVGLLSCVASLGIARAIRPRTRRLAAPT
jgi:hypothetical protein